MSQNGSTNLWSKVKSSTKSLSSSIQSLTIKQEHDGDSPTSTLVHKVLVKYYSTQEPFQGYPEWLGHKADPSEERKHMTRRDELDKTGSSQVPAGQRQGHGQPQPQQQGYGQRQGNDHGHGIVPQRRTPGSSLFQGIVSSNNQNTVGSHASSVSTNAGMHSFKSDPSLSIADRPSISSNSSRYDSVSSRLMQSRLRMNRVPSNPQFET